MKKLALGVVCLALVACVPIPGQSAGSTPVTPADPQSAAPTSATGAGDSSTTPTGPAQTAAAGRAKIGRCPVFPADNPWNTDISKARVHPRSAAWVASIGADTTMHPDFGTEWEGAPIGIPFTTVTTGQRKVPVAFDYVDESDPGPYPIPADAPIEGGPDSDGDRHVLVVDTSTCTLYELFDARPGRRGAQWTAGSGAIFDLNSNELRPAGWTSADAAGLPILPGLVRYDEVQTGAINHALRFTVERSQKAYIPPATHAASRSTDRNLPPMGARFRMKADYDCSDLSAEVQVICTALKKYGMFVADNGSDWFLSGQPDPRWDDEALRDLKQIPGSAFEAVYTGEIVSE